MQDELSFKGVVFNEMKGVYSSPDSMNSRATQHALFPDNTYGDDSGGDPAAIPDLDFEECAAKLQTLGVTVLVCESCRDLGPSSRLRQTLATPSHMSAQPCQSRDDKEARVQVQGFPREVLPPLKCALLVLRG
jgi:hypothetical protein